MVGITLYDRNHTDYFYQDGLVSHAIKMDRNHTCKLLFENCMDCILHDCCVCNVHGINGPGNMLHKLHRIDQLQSYPNRIHIFLLRRGHVCADTMGQ